MGWGGGQAARVVARKTASLVELTSSVMELGVVGGPFSNVGLLELLLVASTPEGSALAPPASAVGRAPGEEEGACTRRRPLDPTRPPLTVQLGGGTALIFFLMHVGSVFIHVRQSAGEHICLAVPKRTIFCSFYRQLRPARSLRHTARAVVRHPCYLPRWESLFFSSPFLSAGSRWRRGCARHNNAAEDRHNMKLDGHNMNAHVPANSVGG
ncbi:hypothetical protein VPH35_008242 [Triticum aestivum]